MESLYKSKPHQTVPSGAYAINKKGEGIMDAHLGSCVGVTLVDHQANLGGLIHLLLPEPTGIDRHWNPFNYASPGLPLFIKALCEAGASKGRLVAHVAGGALIGPLCDRDLILDIGGRTSDIVERILFQEEVYIQRFETGGYFSCRMSLDLETLRTKVEPIGLPSSQDPRTTLKKPLADELSRLMENICPIPQINLKIIRMVRDDNHNLQDIAREIRQDQVLSAKVIRLCNSALFGVKGRIDSIDRALVMLGEKRLLKLAVSASVENFFPEIAHGYSLCKGGLYKHAIGTALTAEGIAGMRGKVSSDIAYTAGLLHDIGKVVLDQHVAAAYPFFYRRTQEEGVDLIQMENELFGTTHPEVGGRLAEAWDLPITLREAIRHHHAPEEATVDPELTHMVYLADLVMSRFLVGQELERLRTDQTTSSLEKIGLSPDQFPEIIDWIPQQLFSAPPQFLS